MTTTDLGATAEVSQGLDNPLEIAGVTFTSRLIVGTGKYTTNQVMVDAIRASGAEMVTVAVPTIRRDVNVTPAISKGLSSPCDTSAVAPRSVVVIGLTPTYEMDNLDRIPFTDIKIGVSVTV
jgi:hypothetical protein